VEGNGAGVASRVLRVAEFNGSFGNYENYDKATTLPFDMFLRAISGSATVLCRDSVLLAQWILNVLQFLTLVAVLWYTWETHRGGMLALRHYEREWKPQYQLAILTPSLAGATSIH
jgi:hypothetical protein